MENTKRKNIMSLCHNAMKYKKVGNNSRSSFNSPEKMEQIITDISEIRKQ